MQKISSPKSENITHPPTAICRIKGYMLDWYWVEWKLYVVDAADNAMSILQFTLLCCNLRAVAWKKIDPKVFYVEEIFSSSMPNVHCTYIMHERMCPHMFPHVSI